ncbi:D-alanine--D-alanine ligase A [Listeria newyorkensis]|uniref:D-alanine--D-alanine ligase n=1 Tax=Listeria newyorkensis TaxID=1497681 RepID=A0ABX4XQR9_9LIST|nr:D-alanine--D-alanine ligase [Listeria newyorkensis]KGL44047.1 D-alanine--D-alanine ligase [Listeria newyorkensis]KMT61509.1 D-alanyl-alanine synthetase A [Listeria newyorkensis]PNP94825.1 D-alanine--D-alanine ligase A [Listeria newyorkensis]WAO21776.1 D-alanine--D-alanine ligase [Listeria newyorkensis]SQC57386.1 D-alanine--D-alanine ligase [Listeria newyorkensis]
MKTKLVLLYGGKSAEHEISLQTAFSVINALEFDKFEVKPIYITNEGDWVQGPDLTGKLDFVEQLRFEQKDVLRITETKESASYGLAVSPASLREEGDMDQMVVFPLLHGPNGEDGTVQGLLEVLNLPYVGAGVLASAAAMDKIVMKMVFADAGIPQVPAVPVRAIEWQETQDEVVAKIETALVYPVFVKPANLGSSVGISKATDRVTLVAAMVEALRYDRRIVVEQGVVAREVEIAVLGNDTPACSVAGEIIPKGAEAVFYDYRAKYQDNDTVMAIPAELDPAVYEQLVDYSKRAFLGLSGSGLVRADFFVTGDNQIFLNEVNTMPGFTPYSMYPLLWQESGLPYSELIVKLVDLAKERHEAKNSLKYTLED